MKDFRDSLLTKSKPPKFCPKCEMNLYLTDRINWIGVGKQPLEYGCYLKCEKCGFEEFWLNLKFIPEINEALGIEGARDFLGKHGWYGKKEKEFLKNLGHHSQPELFDGMDSAYKLASDGVDQYE
ncbi:hypothetical protein [Leptospira ainazelensis]|uniref:hypothetical protein n=1 Tax=Leptospira ainazelensis TaxID=2810034 RepID=UPI001E40DE61|nr:hypothetical protein [Leptospira ainazelensis]